MDKSLKTKLQLAKQRLKFSKLVRLISTPYMMLHTRHLDCMYHSSKDADYIRNLKGKYTGQRCFIIGNGPSLRPEDLDKLQNEKTFGANGIIRIFDKTSWRPTFYICIDQNYITLEGDTIPSIEAEHIFLQLYAKKYIKSNTDKITYINEHRKSWNLNKFSKEAIGFSDEPDRYLATGYTVTYAAMQLALYMGFSKIYLLGVDHTYGRSVNSDGKTEASSDKPTHFFKGGSDGYYYFEGVDYAYHLANLAAKERQATIYNATRGGALEEYERVDFDTLFGSSESEEDN